MTVITGKAYWAHVQAPNTTYEPEWSIDIAVDDNNRSAIEADGLDIKNKGDERGDFVHIRQRVKRRDGTTNDAPAVVDAQKNATEKLIGNGSTVNVLYSPFEWEMNGKSGTSAILKKVQVVDLVSYGEDLEVVDGFVDGQSPTSMHDDEVPF
jgi:hypothetical protein